MIFLMNVVYLVETIIHITRALSWNIGVQYYDQSKNILSVTFCDLRQQNWGFYKKKPRTLPNLDNIDELLRQFPVVYFRLLHFCKHKMYVILSKPRKLSTNVKVDFKQWSRTYKASKYITIQKVIILLPWFVGYETINEENLQIHIVVFLLKSILYNLRNIYITL